MIEIKHGIGTPQAATGLEKVRGHASDYQPTSEVWRRAEALPSLEQAVADALAAPHPFAQKVVGALGGVCLAPGVSGIILRAPHRVLIVQHHQPEVVTAARGDQRGVREGEPKAERGTTAVQCGC